jgi:hypothetical protein
LATNLITKKIQKTWDCGNNSRSTGITIEPAVIGLAAISATTAEKETFITLTAMIGRPYSFNFGKNEMEFYFRDADADVPFAHDINVSMLITFKRVN